MPVAVFTSERHASRYDLLDAMAAQIAAAFARAGFHVNPTLSSIPESHPAIFVFLNFPPSFESLARWCGVGSRRAAILHYFVDHPLALDAQLMDRLCELPNYWLLMPCQDDLHLLRLRWPRLRVAHCPHGVPPETLTPPDPNAPRRETALLIAGSIHSRGELRTLEDRVPQALRASSHEIVRRMAEHPWMSFGQAIDLCLPNGLVTPSFWPVMQTIWRFTTAGLNRLRRERLAAAMQGIPTDVYGPEAWTDVCGGSLSYRGPAGFATLPELMARARVCLAWNPTQFVHSISERVLLAMASGAATVTDDRLATRPLRSAGAVSLFNAADPATARREIDQLLAQSGRCADMGSAAVRLAAGEHLWDHRLEVFAQCASHVLQREGADDRAAA